MSERVIEIPIPYDSLRDHMVEDHGIRETAERSIYRVIGDHTIEHIDGDVGHRHAIAGVIVRWPSPNLPRDAPWR